MAQRRHHYEQAFEEYLRSRRIPYVAVDEAKKALLPAGTAATFRVPEDDIPSRVASPAPGPADEAAWAVKPKPRTQALKSFDFVLYGEGSNLLAEVKGRRVSRPRRPGGAARLECWCTRDDVESLQRWERLFGAGFEAALVFVYWCDELPPDALFEEIFEHRGRWYALRTALISDYARVMRTRSPKWGTVDLAAGTFDGICLPLASRSAHPLPHHRSIGASLGSFACQDPPPLPAMALLE